MANTKITQSNIKDKAVDLTQVADNLRTVGAMVLVEDATVTGDYNVMLSVPFDFEIYSCAYVCSNGAPGVTSTFQIQIDGTPVTWTVAGTSITTPTSTTPSSDIRDAGAGDNAGSLGDIISIEITSSAGAPANLQVQLVLVRTS